MKQSQQTKEWGTIVNQQPVVPYIREAGYDKRRPWYIPERKLLDYLLVYIEEGVCVFHVSGQEYVLTKGDFCLIQPDEIITLSGTSETITPFVHMDVFFNPDRENSFPTKSGQIDLHTFAHLLQPRLNDIQGIHIPVKFIPERKQHFLDLLIRMITLWESGSIVGLLEAQNCGSELVLMLLRQFSQYSSSIQHTPQVFHWITSFLYFHLAHPITVEDMAARAKLSPSRFSALFRQTFGMSPYRYLVHLRIKHAEELLLSSEFNLNQIAEYCGFADAQHLSKAFRKATGRTLGSLRNK